MEKIVPALGWIVANYEAILAAVLSILMGMIAIAMLIPGDQPDKTLQKVVDFISKFSRKKPEKLD